jgi:hypothetical protein
MIAPLLLVIIVAVVLLVNAWEHNPRKTLTDLWKWITK